MPINFHDRANRFTYANRNIDPAWIRFMEQEISWHGKRVVDIGCGGGIYTSELLNLGAKSVVGIDFSEAMLSVAKSEHKEIEFCKGDAYATGLQDCSFDLVFSRALIHHLRDLPAYFREVYRILKPGGIIITQNRTVADCHLPGSPDHLRGYFFEKFPRLQQIEKDRRHNHDKVVQALLQTGFTGIVSKSLWETRKTYATFEQFADEMRNRSGRSILHELTDGEIEELIRYIAAKVGTETPVTDRDRWSVWIAARPE
ncbi:class I SAM-dependent methyltransferase [Thermoactinomyces sp. CICC 10523]|uniref:class I SAM-dependent methyltransferase n=1 Tax=Thermoactinomyces sp. CICC 10523 TaxID=2767428 RepID=UPI0018DE1686|nr:class I SAM-dependent methyltransferase [Thermoactinomyces sp. CICC 10523]MBH8596560.1 methyltransferase domain-containing protein [Thermoactinomyces sp. CICC 10523]